MIRPFTAVLPLLLLSACSGPGAGAADARILHVLQAAGEVDRSAGLLGSETGSDSAVRALGARLAADHAAAGGAAAALARRLRLQPAENPTSGRFRAEGARTR